MKSKSVTRVFEIELLADAEEELANSYDWYEGKLSLLGNKFYHEVSYYFKLIENNPYLFPVKYVEELRAAALNKFPFLIIYWIDEIKHKVYVTSIFHTSRDPKYF